MFSKIKNLGALLKKITTWLFYIELAFSVIGGIVLFCEELFLPGILSIVVGAAVAWFSAFIVYCFGQLIENSDITAGRLTLEEVTKKTTQKVNSSIDIYKQQMHGVKLLVQQTPVFASEVPQESISVLSYFDADGKIRISCPHCKSELCYAKDEFVAERKFACAFCGKSINVSDFID